MKKITISIALTLCFLLFLSVAGYAAEYAHPEILASTEWLAAHLKDPSVVIVDSRSPQNDAAYAGGHIPDAVKLDPFIDLADPQNKVKYQMLTISQFEELMGKLGISNDKTVVVYDASGGLYSAYLWWGLKYYGDDNVKILNGGLTKWLKEGLPIEKVENQPAKATFKAQVRPELLSTIPDVKQAIANPDIYLVNALPETNFLAGHIPTSKNIPAPSHIDAATQTLLPVEELYKIWNEAGINPNSRVITYCGSGLYGSFDTFIAYLLGYEKVSLYDGSWIEWSADPSLPIAKFAHPEILASTDWLAAHLKDPNVVIVDSRSPQDAAAYAGGHIPGAIKLDPFIDLADPQNKVKYQMLTISQFEELMGKLGISNDKTVVVYDASGGLYSAYLWWGLKYYGDDNVKILNGGLTKWMKEGRPIEKIETQPVNATFKAQVRPELLSTIPDVKQAIANPDIYLVNALPETNFLAGHIPTSKNIPAPSHIDPATQTLLPVEELNKFWSEAGINPNSRVITYCGSGLYGSFDTFIAYLLGYEKASLYDGSWIEWSADPSLPIEKGSISASSLKILQVNFKINISGNEYEQAAAGAAPVIANVAGLRWKVWIMNEAEHEAGGIYLFDDQSSLEAFLAGPIVAKVKSNPAYSDISMKQFDVLDKLTQVTRGPIDLNQITAVGKTVVASNVKILQVNFKNSTPRNELEQAFAGAAQPIADVSGLRWKVWIMNEAEHEVGGIYLFNDQSSLEAYLAGPIVAGLKSSPANTDISAKQFDVLDKLTQVTRGPIGLKQIPAGGEDFGNTFFMSLDAGLNMISLPLKPNKEMTARDLMKETGSTVVIKYDTNANHFSGFSQTGSGDGFNLEGGKGYIVNVPANKVIPFVGAAWTNEPPLAPPSGLKSSGWAFVVSGSMSDYQVGDYTATVKNLRTGNISTDSIADGRFNVVFADLNRNSVVEAGDKVEIMVKDSTGKIVAGPITKQIGTGDIQMAFSDITIKFGYLRPQNSVLLQNYPNPFNPETWIPFNLAKEADVSVKIYDTGGKLVRSLSLGRKDPGVYMDRDKAIHWDGKSDFGEVVSSGIYFYTIQAGEFSATRKMIVKK